MNNEIMSEVSLHDPSADTATCNAIHALAFKSWGVGRMTFLNPHTTTCSKPTGTPVKKQIQAGTVQCHYVMSESALYHERGSPVL